MARRRFDESKVNRDVRGRFDEKTAGFVKRVADQIGEMRGEGGTGPNRQERDRYNSQILERAYRAQQDNEDADDDFGGGDDELNDMVEKLDNLHLLPRSDGRTQEEDRLADKIRQHLVTTGQADESELPPAPGGGGGAQPRGAARQPVPTGPGDGEQLRAEMESMSPAELRAVANDPDAPARRKTFAKQTMAERRIPIEEPAGDDGPGAIDSPEGITLDAGDLEDDKYHDGSYEVLDEDQGTWATLWDAFATDEYEPDFEDEKYGDDGAQVIEIEGDGVHFTSRVGDSINIRRKGSGKEPAPTFAQRLSDDIGSRRGEMGNEPIRMGRDFRLPDFAPSKASDPSPDAATVRLGPSEYAPINNMPDYKLRQVESRTLQRALNTPEVTDSRKAQIRTELGKRGFKPEELKGFRGGDRPGFDDPGAAMIPAVAAVWVRADEAKIGRATTLVLKQMLATPGIPEDKKAIARRILARRSR